MAFTGKLGIVQSKPGNIILGVAGGGDATNQDASSTLALTSSASCTTKDVSATSSLAPTQTASTTTPWHADATSTLAPTSTAVSSIKMLSASSSLSLTQSTRANAFDLSASSALTLTSTGRSNIMFASGSVALSLTQSAEAGAVSGIASSALALTQSVVVTGGSYFPVASSALSLTSTVSVQGSNRQSLANALVLSSTADVIAPHYLSASSPITLTQSAQAGIYYVSASNALVFLDTAATFGRPINAFATSTLALTQSAVNRTKVGNASSSLSLTQTLVVHRSITVLADSELQQLIPTFDIDTFTVIDVIVGLQDSAVASIAHATFTASNILSFASEAMAAHVRADGTSVDASSTLAMTSEARTSKQADASSSLTLTQSASAQVGIAATSDLSTIDCTASANVVYASITASNTLEITQSVAFIFEKGDTLCTYTSFVGSSSDPNAPTPPPTSYTAAGGTPGFRLQYPGTGSVTDELILRNPNLGNVDRLSMVRINRETRGGTLIVYADPIWPKVESLLLSFSGLSYQQGQDLMTFLESHIGEEIRLIDHEDRLWKGVIVNPQDPVVQDGPGCRYTGSFEFEGELV